MSASSLIAFIRNWKTRFVVSGFFCSSRWYFSRLAANRDDSFASSRLPFSFSMSSLFFLASASSLFFCSVAARFSSFSFSDSLANGLSFVKNDNRPLGSFFGVSPTPPAAPSPPLAAAPASPPSAIADALLR